MEGESPPVWAQSTAAFLPHRRRSSPPILNPVLLILLIPILFLLLIFFLLPPFLTHTSQFLRAGTVKQSWDSFNVLLVLCAILCGVFARRNDAGSANTDIRTNTEDQVQVLDSNPAKSQPSASGQWFVQDRPSPMMRTPATGSSRRSLTRNSSSYPDLRRESLWETDESRFRFFDDFELNHYRVPPEPATLHHLPARRTTEDRGDFLIKEIPVDTAVVHPTSTARPSSPPRPRPKSLENQSQQVNPVQRRTFQSVPREEEKVEQDQFQFKIQTTTSDQPPSPQLVKEEAIANRTQERKLKRSDRKKSGSAKDIATAIATSLYSQRKRKRRTRARSIYDNANESASPAEEQPTPTPQMAAPPPPPPPTPPSFFQNIFKKGGKAKRVHSVSVSVSTSVTPPPPPPPPPPRSLFNNLLKTGGKSKRFQSASTSPSGPPPPPPPPPSSIFNNIFKSNTKSKRFHSTSTPPPPPSGPPPLPSSTFRNIFRTGSKNKRFDPITRYPPWSDQSYEEPRYSQPQSPRLHTPPPSDSPRRRSTTAGRPPLPTKMNHYYDGNENINSGAQSPLIRIPSPPPLPPFRLPDMKFIARGDFVRIRSTHSSRCSSPGLDDLDFPPSRSSDATDGGDVQGSVTSTCPSPDVNLKADSFIARLRGEWRIELMNSVKERKKMGQQQP